MRYVAASAVTDRQTHRHPHTTTTITLTHMPRVFGGAHGSCHDQVPISRTKLVFAISNTHITHYDVQVILVANDMITLLLVHACRVKYHKNLSQYDTFVKGIEW